MDPIASLHLRVDQIEGMLRQVLDALQPTKCLFPAKSGREIRRAPERFHRKEAKKQ